MRSLSKKDRQGYSILAAVAVVLMLLIGSAVFASRTADKYDPATFCPKQKTFSQTVMLVDMTDPLEPSQTEQLRLLIRQISAELQRYEKLTILVITSDGLSAAPLFALCNPGNPDEANPVYENPRMVRQKYEQRFGEPLNLALAEATRQHQSDFSPIMEAIQRVAGLPEFIAAQAPPQRRRLIIFSDMVQHVPAYSQYRGHAAMKFDAFRKTDYAARVLSPLPGVEVSLYYVLRPEKKPDPQGNEHISFWAAYFEALGAQLVKVQKVR